MKVSKRTDHAKIHNINRPHIVMMNGLWCVLGESLGYSNYIKFMKADKFCNKLNKQLAKREGV